MYSLVIWQTNNDALKQDDLRREIEQRLKDNGFKSQCIFECCAVVKLEYEDQHSALYKLIDNCRRDSNDRFEYIVENPVKDVFNFMGSFEAGLQKKIDAAVN